MYGYWRISILIYIASSASAQQNGGNLYCPKKWTAGQTVTLEFHIDQVLYPFQCTGTTDKRPVFLRSTTANGPPKIMCRTADITAMNACTTPLSGDCGCIEKNGSYVLQYMFKANTTIHNGWWSASVQCLNGIATQMLSFTETQCSNITVQETSTVPPSTSGSVPPTSSTSPQESVTPTSSTSSPDTMSTSPELATRSTEPHNTKTSTSTPLSSPTAPATTPTPTTSTKSDRKYHWWSASRDAIIVGVAYLSVAIMCVLIVIICRRKEKNKQSSAEDKISRTYKKGNSSINQRHNRE